MEDKIKRKLRLDEDGTPYVICPKCHKQIYKLNGYRIHHKAIPIKTTQDFDYKNVYNDVDYPDLYVCPECNEVLAKNEKEVKDLFFEPKHRHRHKVRV